jgi:drug/metabolite transporter (DMT)-like permease
MSGGLTLPMLALIAFCIVMEAEREVCFKQAADNEAFLAAIVKPIAWLGIVFWGVELVAWTIVLEHVALSIAFPLMALSYVAIVLAGAWRLKERINIRHGLGALLVTVGVACVGATGI